MKQDEVTRTLAEPLSRQLLDSPVPARLAYTGLDGDPRVVPVGFWWTGAELLVFTLPAAAKVAALRKNPRVAVTVDTEGFPPNALLIRGAATVEVENGVPGEYLDACRKAIPAGQFADWEAGVRALYREMARITIVPDWAKLLDFETTLPKAVADLVSAQQS